MRPDDDTASDDDPVRAGAPGDLQNVATLEPRSSLDRFAVWLHGALRSGLTSALVGVEAAIMLYLFRRLAAYTTAYHGIETGED